MGQTIVRKSGNIFHSCVSCVHKDYVHFFSFIQSLPSRFEQGEGTVIYKGRNELREFHYEGMDLVVKSFCKPHFINQIVYGLFRSSKAQRCNGAKTIRLHGIQTAARTPSLVEAAQEQLNAIRILREFGMISKLPIKLQQAVEAREKNPEASLTELAGMMVPSITKPAMNHRLKKIVEIAKEAAQ